jgi:hypothetical protein
MGLVICIYFVLGIAYILIMSNRVRKNLIEFIIVISLWPCILYIAITISLWPYILASFKRTNK